MQTLTVLDIVKATGGKLISGDENTVIYNITTDSRAVSEGAFFIPIVGTRDGHDFIESAFESGAVGVITHKDITANGKGAIIRVDNTLRAFGDIAKYYKEKYRVPTVAIVGSVGKTTTKDLTAGVLSMKYNTLKTMGNYNNELGVPITILGLEKEHRAAVIEMGMSGFGEIERLAQIGTPDMAIMTNIGVSHIENLGSREGIFKAKMEICKNFNKSNTLIVNGDDEFLSTICDTNPPYKVVQFGINNHKCDIYAENISDNGIFGVDFTICDGENKYDANIVLPGEHNVYNAVAAYAAGKEMGIAPENIIEGIRTAELTKNRLTIENKDGIITINDYYNAAPDSVRASVRVLSNTKSKRRIAILGDILELGEISKSEHEKLGQFVAKSGIDALICAGSAAMHLARVAKDNGMSQVFEFETTEEASVFARDFVKDGDTVLIKASHSMNFGKIHDAIRKESK